jgi:hypothetical protein
MIVSFLESFDQIVVSWLIWSFQGIRRFWYLKNIVTINVTHIFLAARANFSRHMATHQTQPHSMLPAACGTLAAHFNLGQFRAKITHISPLTAVNLNRFSPDRLDHAGRVDPKEYFEIHLCSTQGLLT